MNAVVALCHFCELHGPVVVMCTQPYNNKYSNPKAQLQVIDKCTGEDVKNFLSNHRKIHLYETANQGNNQKPGCPSCTSTGKHGIPLISNDTQNSVTYMSSESPEDTTQFSLLRHACIRSLTCEITPGDEGAIYFGEESSTHVLSYRFKLQNAFARGQISKYSIVVISKDKLALLNIWPFLVNNLKTIVGWLQKAADNVCREEQGSENARSMRFATSNVGVGGGNASALHPAVNYRTKAENDLRSLSQITRIENVFQQLHVWFTWLLRVGESTYQNLQLVDPDCSSGNEESILFNTDMHAGGCYADEELEQQMIYLIQLYQMLGEHDFSLLAYHTVVGNQVIVRCSNELLCKLVVKAISRLLPKKCARVGASKTSYKPLFQYNLLALDNTVMLSHEVTDIDADPCVVLLITIHDHVQDQLPALSSDQVSIRMDSTKPPIVGSSLATVAMTTSPPRVIKQYMEIMYRASQGLHQYLSSSSSSSQLLSTSSNYESVNSEDTTVPTTGSHHFYMTPNIALTTMKIVICDWINKSELYYAYKRKQTSFKLSDAAYGARLDSFLKSIGVHGVSDQAVLRFWVDGLADERKKHINSNSRGDYNIVESSGVGS